MNEQKTYLSKEKFKELTDELDFLKTTRRQEIAKQLEIAKSYGDLSENAEYHQVRESQATAEGRVVEVETMLKNVEIVSHHKSDVIDVGTTAVLQREGEKDKKSFEIVGSEEADLGVGKISLNSPLGQALMGKKKGEKFIFTTPSGKDINYKVLKIE